jgi:phosphatidate phosphatase APP1
MTMLTKTFRYILRKAKSPYKRSRLLLKHQLGWLGIPCIKPYLGFCNDKQAYLSGSVMEDKGLEKPKEGQSLRLNMLAMIKRYISDEIAGVRVKISFRDKSEIVETNELGIFHCYLNFDSSLTGRQQFEQCHYELLDEVIENQGSVTAEGKVLMVTDQPPFGVISDIDDTIMVSHSTDTVKKLKLMLFKNAHTRVPFEGVAAFYRALQKGRKRQKTLNPLFYVSSSEWNLYDLLDDFMAFRDIPAGPFMLQELEHSIFHFWKSGGGTHEHKLKKILFLLSFFKKMNFILIGDSGQRDPQLYLKAAKKAPGRIIAVYIRCIDKRHKNPQMQEIKKEMDALKVPMLLISDTEEAARHALINDYIDASSMPDIARQVQEDHKKTGFLSDNN